MPSLSPSSLPFLGAGVGYRRAIAPFYARYRKWIGFLEVMPEHVVSAPTEARDALLAAVADFPVVSHSVTLSVGSATGPDRPWMRTMAAVNRDLGAPWASDHLCFTKVGDRVVGQLTPIPYTEEALRATVRNVREVQAAFGIPFLVENISAYFTYAGADFTEPEFFTELARKTGCGVLLDVTNLGNNAVNLGWSPKEYLDAMPLERVVQLHLAGAEWTEGKLLDTHGAPIHAEVWALTREVIARCDVRGLLIERDQTFGPMPRLAGEVRKAHDLMRKARGAGDARPMEAVA